MAELPSRLDCFPYLRKRVARPKNTAAPSFPLNASARAANSRSFLLKPSISKSSADNASSSPARRFTRSVSPMPNVGRSPNSAGRRFRGVNPTSCRVAHKRVPRALAPCPSRPACRRVRQSPHRLSARPSLDERELGLLDVAVRACDSGDTRPALGQRSGPARQVVPARRARPGLCAAAMTTPCADAEQRPDRFAVGAAVY